MSGIGAGGGLGVAGGGMAMRGMGGLGMAGGAKGTGTKHQASSGDFGRDGALTRGAGFSTRDAFQAAGTKGAQKPGQAATARQASKPWENLQQQMLSGARGEIMMAWAAALIEDWKKWLKKILGLQAAAAA